MPHLNGDSLCNERHADAYYYAFSSLSATAPATSRVEYQLMSIGRPVTFQYQPSKNGDRLPSQWYPL